MGSLRFRTSAFSLASNICPFNMTIFRRAITARQSQESVLLLFVIPVHKSNLEARIFIYKKNVYKKEALEFPQLPFCIPVYHKDGQYLCLLPFLMDTQASCQGRTQKDHIHSLESSKRNTRCPFYYRFS